MRKKVVILKNGAHSLHSGGLEKYTNRLALAFLNKECDVTFLTTGNPHHLPSPFKTISFRQTSKLSFRKVAEFDRFCIEKLKDLEADVVFGMDRNSFQTHLRAGNGVHAAYLQQRKQTEGLFKKLSFTLNPLHRTILKLEKNAFEHSDLKCLFTNSHMVKEEVLHNYRVDPNKIHVIHNGVEWHEMQSDFLSWPEGRRKLCVEMQLDPHLFHFVFIGHNFRRKGLDQLLEGLTLLPRNFYLSVVGQDKNLAYYQAVVRKLNLQNHVNFFGARKDIARFYQLADALVIPSQYDPFANVTVEALAMGVFVVSSKTNGGSEILTNRNGVVIKSLADPDAIAEALRCALMHPKTSSSASEIRQTAEHLDFSNQLNLVTALCL